MSPPPTRERPRRPARRTRATFRLAPELVQALRQLPNQTRFVEVALQEALGRQCAACHGTGIAPEVHLAVSNFKRLPGARLDRSAAAQLKALVRLGRELLATQLELETRDESTLGFRLARDEHVLLSGRIPRGRTGLSLTH